MELHKIINRFAKVSAITFSLSSNAIAIETLTSYPPLHSQQTSTVNHILYLMHTGDTAKALQAYQTHRKESGSYDFELIEQLGLILLDQGSRSDDREIKLLTLFGAGISADERALYIVEDALKTGDSDLQMLSLNFLAKFQNNRADFAIYKALASNNLLVRLETLLQLASKKDPKTVSQIEALMAKVPEEIWPIFPQILAESGSPDAKKILRKLLTHRDELVRIAVILSIAEHNHDDFLPHIRRMASHLEPSQQEASCTALGILKDEKSVPRLNQLSKSVHPNVRLAALNSLYQLGREEVSSEIIKMARSGDVFAIYLLGKIHGSEQVLKELIKSDNVQIKINAAVSLLEHRDTACLPVIASLLLRDAQDFGIGKLSSGGRSLTALKAIPSSKQNFEENSVGLELSLHLKEALLLKTVELPEPEFLSLANHIFETGQNDLIPSLIAALENHPTEKVINLLKKQHQKIGAPLIRNYCNLALYRLKEEGPYAENLQKFVALQKNIDLIQFRPIVTIDLREIHEKSFELTPQETSRLLVETFEAFASARDDRGIDLLISVIESGNPKNKYALIGLLMRAIQ